MMDGRRDLPLEPKSWLSNPKGLRVKKKERKKEKNASLVRLGYLLQWMEVVLKQLH